MNPKRTGYQLIFFFIVLFYWSTPLQAQSDSTRIFRVWAVPFNYFFGIYNGPQINVGGDFQSPKGVIWQLSYSRFVTNPIFKEGIWDNNQGRGWMFSRGQVFNNRKLNAAGMYSVWGLEAHYLHQSYGRTDEVWSGVKWLKKAYSNQRRVVGLVANVQQIKDFKSGFYLGSVFGFGLRYSDVSTSLSQDEADSRDLGDYTSPVNWIQKPGKHLVPRFQFELRMGFHLR